MVAAHTKEKLKKRGDGILIKTPTSAISSDHVQVYQRLSKGGIVNS